MKKVVANWIAAIVISVFVSCNCGCALTGSRLTGVALQPDQEYMAPSGTTSLVVQINEGRRYVCQTFTASRDELLAAVSVDISAARFRRVSRRDPMLPRTLLLPARLFPQYNLAIVLFSVRENQMQERLSEFQVSCDNVAFESGPVLDTVLLLPDQILLMKGQQYAICAYYPDAPTPEMGGTEVGTWTGGVRTRPDQRTICSDDGVKWEFECIPDRSLNFRTYVVGNCEQPDKDIDKDVQHLPPWVSVFPSLQSRLQRSAAANATIRDISVILGRQPDKCEDIKPTPMLGVLLSSDGTISNLRASGSGSRAGLSVGERILKVNGVEVNSAENVVAAVRTTVKWDERSIIVTDKNTYTVSFEKPSKALQCYWSVSGGVTAPKGGSTAGTLGEPFFQAGKAQTEGRAERLFRASCRFYDGKAIDCSSSW